MMKKESASALALEYQPVNISKRMNNELSRLEGMKCRMGNILVIGRHQAEHDQ